MDENTDTTHSTTSLQSLSIRVFHTLGPVKKLPLFSPRNHTINSPTAIFSPPLSALTREGYHHSEAAC